MKVLTKRGDKFAVGMFWQIPEEGKRAINFYKLVKDTRYDMFCQIKTLRPTWGFCLKAKLHGEKKVASLGKFIVESSNLSADYVNSIICYKFKQAGESDETGKKLESDQFGYIVLLNGTICPDDGEYVAEFYAVRESIIQKAKKHEIEALYLPSEVSSRFFGIFECLEDAYANDSLLLSLMHNSSDKQLQLLRDFINTNFANNADYLKLVDKCNMLELDLLRNLIKEPAFVDMVKATRDTEIKYLISNVYSLPFTSNEVYWNNNKFRLNFNKYLIKPIASMTNDRYKIAALIGLWGFGSYLGYDYFFAKDNLEHMITKPQVIVPKPVPVLPATLIKACLQNNDKYFKDLGNWTLSSLKCNSLYLTLTLNSQGVTTLGEFMQLTGDKKARLNGKVGLITNSLHLPAATKSTIDSKIVLTRLQQAAVNYRFKLTFPKNSNSASRLSSKFTISSTLSPVFLLNKGILDQIKLTEIRMHFDNATGFYNWLMQGEI